MCVWYYDKPRTQFLSTRGSVYLGFTCVSSGKILAAGNLPPPRGKKRSEKNTKQQHRERKKQLSRSF